MSRTVQVEYQVLSDVEAKFAQLSRDIMQMRNNVNARLEALQGGGWKGEGSDAFFSEMNELVTPALERLQQAFERARATTRQVASRFQEAEEQTLAGMSVVDQPADSR